MITKSVNILNRDLTVILIEDRIVGGYTAYFKEYPDVISEGGDQNDAINNITYTIMEYFKYLENV